MTNESKGYIVIAFLLFFIFINGIINGAKYPPSPRLNNGVDSVFTEDSVYIMHFTIDSVYENQEDAEDDPIQPQ
jgi:hypothetical protein